MQFTGYKLDLSRIKLVFCDFDDTICIHLSNNINRPTEKQWNEARGEGYRDIYTETFKDIIVPNEFLHKWLLTYVTDAEKYLLSWTEPCFLGAKFHYAVEKFSDVHFSGAYCSPNAREKVEILKQIASVRGFAYNELLLIDDHPTVIEIARSEGFSAISTIEVAYMVSKEMFE